MLGLLLVLQLARLPCYPFEVEGDDAAASRAAPAPAPLPGLDPPPPPAPARAPAAAPPPAAPLAPGEDARYDVRFGVFGSIGTLSLSLGALASGKDGAPVIAVRGEGEGALLGLGQMQRRLEAEFDLGARRSRRWTTARTKGGETTVDVAERQPSGALKLERRRARQPPQQQTATFALPTSDPLGLVLQLRLSPPAPGRPETLQALDGLQLWRVRVWTAVLRERVPGQERDGLRLEGEASPVFFDGTADDDRPTRRFKLWLSDDAARLPLRLEIPIGVAQVAITLEEVRGSRTATSPPPDEGQRQVAAEVPGARSL